MQLLGEVVLLGFFSLLLDNPGGFSGVLCLWERIVVGWRCLKASRHRPRESGTLKKGNLLFLTFLPGKRLGCCRAALELQTPQFL